MDDERPSNSGCEPVEAGPSRPLLPKVVAALFGFGLLGGYVIWRSLPPKAVEQIPLSGTGDRESEFRAILFAGQAAPPDLNSEQLVSLAFELTLISEGFRLPVSARLSYRDESFSSTSKSGPLYVYPRSSFVDLLRDEIAARISKGEPICQLPPCQMPQARAQDDMAWSSAIPTPPLPPVDLLFERAIQIARGGSAFDKDFPAQANNLLDPSDSIGETVIP